MYRYKNPYLREKMKQRLKKYMRGASVALIPFAQVILSMWVVRMDAKKQLAMGLNVDFWDVFENQHPALFAFGFIFGLTGLVLCTMAYMGGEREKLDSILYPECGGEFFSKAEIDDMIAAPETVFIESLGVYMTPGILVGWNEGVKVIRYDEVRTIRFCGVIDNVRGEDKKWTQAPVWTLTLEAKDGWNIRIAKVRSDELTDDLRGAVSLIHQRCKAYNEHLKDPSFVQSYPGKKKQAKKARAEAQKHRSKKK